MSYKQVKIKDVAELLNGYPFKTEEWELNGIPIIRIQNLNNPEAHYNYSTKDLPERYRINKGDILIAWAGSLGVYCWENSDEAFVNQHLFKVEFKTNEIDKSYFRHIIHQALKELAGKARGAGLKHLKKEQIDNYEFKLPNPDEQKRVVVLLTGIEELIKKRQMTLNLLDEYRSNLFLELFLENPKIVDNSKYWGTISDVVVDSVYGVSKLGNSEQIGIPMLRMNNLTPGGELDLTDLKWVNLNSLEKKKYQLNHGDILFNRTNSKELVGKTTVWTNGPGFTFAGYLVKLVLDKQKINPFYFSSYMNSRFGKKILFNKAKPSGNLVNFSPSLLKKQRILIPPLSLQEKYEASFRKIMAQKDSALRSLLLLEELYSSSIYKSFKHPESLHDEVDTIMKDSIQLEILVNTINQSVYDNENQYNIELEKLYEILERTEQKNKQDPDNLNGIVQLMDGDTIVIETNREYKYRLSDAIIENKN